MISAVTLLPDLCVALPKKAEIATKRIWVCTRVHGAPPAPHTVHCSCTPN